MTVLLREAERQRLHQIAREYEDKGYDVVIEPDQAELPSPLASFRPDMLVRKGDEAIVIEVTSRPSLQQSERFEKLKRLIENVAGWRLELVLVNGIESSPGRRSWNESEISAYLAQAEQLASSRQFLPALLLAWSATEAVLRRLAEQTNTPSDDASPALMKALVSEGIVSREVYRALESALKERNLAAHGFTSDDLNPETTKTLVRLARDLLAEASQSDLDDELPVTAPIP